MKNATATATPACCRREVALNKEGNVPTELLVLPAGRFDGRDGRWWINDAPEAIVQAFNAQNMDLPIDYEHSSETLAAGGGPIPAAGWITGLDVRAGAVWANVNWTDRASNYIRSREYRYTSPAFVFRKNTRRIAMLSSIALTNQPNLQQAALNKRDGTPAPDPRKEITMTPETRLGLCRSLGLADEAGDASIAAAVEALKTDVEKALNSAKTPSLEKFVPRGDHDKLKSELETAQNSLAAINEKEVTGLVDAAVAAGKIDPGSKDYHLAACKIEGGLDRFKAMVGDLAVNAVTKLSNMDGKTPPNASGTLSDEEKAMCKLTGTKHEDFLKERDGEKAA